MSGYIKCECGMFEIATEESGEFREKGGSHYLEVGGGHRKESTATSLIR